MNETQLPPALSIDLKKSRIRIHKNALQAIGKPNYILLLINPDQRTLVVQATIRGDPRAHHLSWSAVKSKTSFEIYSRSLIGGLRDVCVDWQDDQLYRMYGSAIDNENAIRFDMDTAILAVS